MGNFTKWLVDKGYVTSEDKHTIEEELSSEEADILYEKFIEEGNIDDE